MPIKFIRKLANYHTTLHQNLTSSFQVIDNFLSKKYENSSQGQRSKVKVSCHF